MSRRRWIQIGVAVVVAVVVWITWRVVLSPPARSLSLTGSANAVRNADVTVQDIDGRTISTRTLKGKVVIVNF